MSAESDLRSALPDADIGDDFGLGAVQQTALTDQTEAQPQRTVSFADEIDAATADCELLCDRFDKFSWHFDS
jgi:hypothetical protein